MSEVCFRKNKKKDLPSPVFKKNRAGFTLIELLVVIAIIAVIASIVLINLSNARNKGKDTAIKSSMRELRNAGQLYYDQNETYIGICDPADDTLSNNDDFGRIEDYMIKQGVTEVYCLDTAFAYAVIVNLNLGDCWCVDAESVSKEVSLPGGETCADQLFSTTCP